MIVADTCIIIYLNQSSEFTPQAEALYAKDQHWIYPAIWEDEYLNVLSKKAKLENLSLREATDHFREVKRFFQFNEKNIDKVHALHLAIQYGITAYDAQFVALAELFSLPLITEDRELLKKCPHCAISLRTYLT